MAVDVNINKLPLTILRGVTVRAMSADLVTVKTLSSSDATPAEGETVTFDITVTNNGPDTATNVLLEAQSTRCVRFLVTPPAKCPTAV